MASATLYASGLGVYDVWLNGQRVGERQSDGSMAYDQLKPGWTDYNHRVAYSAYDVTDLCRKGDNSLGAIVTPGWLASRISRGQYRHPLGLSFIAMLKIEYADGSTLVIPTDDTWATEKLSPILKSDIYDGECYDARREMPWADPSTTMPCKPELYDYPGALEPMRGPSVRALAPLQPVKTVVYELDGQGSVVERQVVNGNTPFTLRAGETALVDFGQNCSGVPQITVKGNVGTQVRMRFGEMLNDTGESSRGNDGPAGTLYTANLRSARAEARYVMRGRGDGETYSPTTTFFGYRYCEITATANVAIEQIETHPWSSSHSLNGMIETDNEDVNRLYSNILWSQISNFLSIPTDCPQRDERLGWTADAQLFASTAMYNADVAEFYAKWLGDLRDSQTADGAYTDVCPASLTEYGSAGWSDAGIVVPWQIYLMTGDHSAIAEHYESMERYMSWLASLKDETLVYPGALARYGDLFSPHPAHNRFVSQAYYYLDAVLMAKMSAVLADAGDSALRVKAQTYEALAQAIKQEIQSRWFVTSGLKAPSQSACVIALWFDLCHTDLQRKSTIEALVSLIRDNGYRLDTGFISTAYILQALCDYGYSDVAYELLTQHEYPSWMHMIDNGATTMWENWYCYMPDAGFCDVQRNSFNHYALGSFGSWMYTHMAGISATEEAAGFGKILFAPSIDTRPDCEPGRKVSRAKAVKQTAHGEVSAEWQLADDGSLTYDISVPEGSVGEVRLPFFSEDDTVYVNGQEAGLSDIVDPLPDAGGRHAFAVKPGQYHFAVGNKLSIAAVPMATGISVWPNPARDIVNIDCAEPILEVSVTSLSGKLLLKAGNAERIDVSTLPAGFYILTITTPSTTHPTKLIKR